MRKTIKFIECKLLDIVKEQDAKMDKIEARQVRKIIEFKKMISDLEFRSQEMYYQNLQMRESMEIERAHAKKERAESVRQRAESHELMRELISKDRLMEKQS